MNNTITPLNFNGYWQVGKSYTKIKPNDGAKIIVNELIYHPFSGESRKFINAEMNKIRSGWCYDALEQHPYYGKDRAQGIYELFIPKKGKIDKGHTAEHVSDTTEATMERIGSNLTETEFSAKRNITYATYINDVMKLTKERVTELFEQYFPELLTK